MRVWNNVESDKIVWPTGGDSVSMMRIKDSKRKVFKGFWRVGDKSSGSLEAIGLEYMDNPKTIVGLVKTESKEYYWILLDTKSKERNEYPTSLVVPRGTIE